MAAPKEKPRYNPKQEKNPIYNKWEKATRAGKVLPFSVPVNEIPVAFDYRDVAPYTEVGPYSTVNYKLGANYVPQIMSRWPEMNFNDAVGLAAQYIYESGGNPQAREGRIPQENQPVVPSKMTGPGGFGLAQLTGPRKKAFWDFVGRDPQRAADPIEQMAYMKAESEGRIPKLESEKGMYAAARGAKNPAQAAYNAAKYIERPLTAESWPTRMALADSIAKYAVNMPRRQQPAVVEPSMLTRMQQFVPETWNKIVSIFD